MYSMSYSWKSPAKTKAKHNIEQILKKYSANNRKRQN